MTTSTHPMTSEEMAAVIRDMERDVAGFTERRPFCKHVRLATERAYEGVTLTSGGGTLRSLDADRIDRQWQAAWLAAGYAAMDEYEFAVAIWNRAHGHEG